MKSKNSVANFEFFSTIFIMLLGTFLHFIFNLSNKNLFVGIFSAINESTWEHLKILFFPILLTTIVGYFYTKKYIDNYICSKTIGILMALSFIIIFFYTYTGILGKNIPILDISSFYIAILLGEYYTLKKIDINYSCNKFISILLLLVLFICFSIFTFNPPHIGIFKDPITNTYGLVK